MIGARKFTYAARILDQDLSQRLDNSRNKELMKDGNRVNEKPMYAFVVLRTPDYKGRVAKYGENPEIEIKEDSFTKLGTLIHEDKKELMDDICSSDGCPIALKEYVQELRGSVL